LAAALPSNSVERFTCRQRTFAQVIAMATVHRGLRKTSAVKFLVQLTEGPPPTRKRETDHIDYSAGLAAKELLMKKLERG